MSEQVIKHIIEKMVLDKPLDGMNGGGTLDVGLKPWQKLRPSIEILCNNEASDCVLQNLTDVHLYKISQ